MERTEIMQILVDWNFWGNYKDESISREYYIQKLKEMVNTGEIIVVKGVRRSGKSTILLQFIKTLIENGLEVKNTLIINFEDPRFKELDLELLNKIYEIYLEELQPSQKHYVVLDEVQEVKGWEKFVRFLHEAKKVTVFVTGSSSKLLSEEYATLLSGRHVDIEIFPLSFDEFLFFKGLKLKTEIEKTKLRHEIKGLLKEYMQFGAFPKVSLTTEKKMILENYFRDILLKDVQKRFKIKDVDKLEQLAKYYMANISNLHSFNKIKGFIRISLDSIERFSNYLSIARLLFFVPKFSFSLKQQILNPKKVYCIDTGLRNIVGFVFSEDVGRIAENIVFLKLLRDKKEIFYFRNLKQQEVDFVIKNGKKIQQLIQVCWDIEKKEIKKRELDALLGASKELKCNNLLVITQDYEGEERIKGKKITFIPLWKWLLI